MHSQLAQQHTNPLASTDSPLLDSSSEINQDLSGGAGGAAERGVLGKQDGWRKGLWSLWSFNLVYFIQAHIVSRFNKYLTSMCGRTDGRTVGRTDNNMPTFSSHGGQRLWLLRQSFKSNDQTSIVHFLKLVVMLRCSRKPDKPRRAFEVRLVATFWVLM